MCLKFIPLAVAGLAALEPALAAKRESLRPFNPVLASSCGLQIRALLAGFYKRQKLPRCGAVAGHYLPPSPTRA